MNKPASAQPAQPQDCAREETSAQVRKDCRNGEVSALPPAGPEDHSRALRSVEREAITFYRPMEDREADHAPLSAQLIRRMFAYTRPYVRRRNWLFLLTFLRGLQLPALAWMIGETINGPIAGQNLPGIYLHAELYLALVLSMVVTLHFRQRFALELGGPGARHEIGPLSQTHLHAHVLF